MTKVAVAARVMTDYGNDSNVIAVSKAIPDYENDKPGGLTVANKKGLRAGDKWIGINDNKASVVGFGLKKYDHDGIHHASFAQPVEYPGFYEDVANAFYWPLMHGGKATTPSKQAQADSAHVNRMAAEHALAEADENSIFWIHDYQLLAMPPMLRGMGVSNHIGFFLHIPFPSQADFNNLDDEGRALAEKDFKALLESVDTLGLQTKRDRRHVREFALRMGAEVIDKGTLSLGGHIIKLEVCPASIDPTVFTGFHYDPTRQSQTVSDILAEVGNKKMFLGVDRADPAKGVLERLLAFEQLLTESPELADQISFVQIAPQTRNGVPAYDQYFADIQDIADRINSRYEGFRPVILHTDKINREEQLPYLYRRADVCLVTSIRDGMNLVAKEFIAAQNDNDPGVLLLGKMVGAAEDLGRKNKYMPGAQVIDPENIAETVGAMKEALNLKALKPGLNRAEVKSAVDEAWNGSLDKRQGSFRYMMDKICAFTDAHWGARFRQAIGASVNDNETQAFPAVRRANERWFGPTQP